MLDLLNRAGFAVWYQPVTDREGYEQLVVIVKATFAVSRDRLIALEEHAPVAAADAYRGDPACSSIQSPSDLVLEKVGADILLSGFAHPAREGDKVSQVELRVGDLRKRALVRGDRSWRTGPLGPSIEGPRPLEPVPLIFERAFGGANHPDNPAGTGFRGSSERSQRVVLPNIEYPDHQIISTADRPPPCGFGPVAPHWPLRRRFAGTYDAAWRAQRMPLLPMDFDPLFNNCAPEDQQLPAPLRGDEEVMVAGVQPRGAALNFRLPAYEVEVAVHDGGRRHDLSVRLDTLSIRAAERRVDLVWRTSLNVHNRVHEVEWIRVDARARAANG